MTRRYSIAAALGLLLMSGCAHPGGHGEPLLSQIEGTPAAAAPDVTTAPAFDSAELHRVEGYDNRPEFHVRSREEAIERFPCSSCHDVPLAQMTRREAGKRAAHWDVVIEHAGPAVMQCATCHLDQDMNSLRSLSGDKVSLNHSYQVCAQCHSRQASDWAGGAHGKRVAGWAPPRVVESCVECHNPHQPAWDIRWPAGAGRNK
ncbi:MAG: cytochrome C [Bryobacteraceae bacterium]